MDPRLPGDDITYTRVAPLSSTIVALDSTINYNPPQIILGAPSLLFPILSQSVDDLFDRIYQHPFNQALSQGVLSQATFFYYLEQDALYLGEFSKALAITAARLPNLVQSQSLLRCALEAIDAEHSLHAEYLRLKNETGMNTLEPDPACFMYTNYILKMASLASVEEAVACLLPCFWVYREVGKKISGESASDNPYAAWINLYSSEAFNQSVEAVIAIVNELGDSASDTLREKMKQAFMKSTQLEWLFWDGAYQHNAWISV